MPLPEDIDALSPAELKLLVVKLLEEVADLRRTVAAQRDEIARLKGGPGRPNIKPNSKPSGMEQATDPKPPGSSNERRRRGSTRAKLTINEERTIKLGAPSPDARFKGYTSFVVQELVLHSHVIDFRCERWLTADGKVTTAPLPEGFDGHFGPQLRRFVLAQYHQGQTTVPRLVTLLRGLGIDISKREVVRLLTASHDRFREEARDVLRAGLASAAWITVDDTGAATRPIMASAPRSATPISLPSPPPPRRAASTSSACCAPAMAITSSMMRRSPTCANGRWRRM